MNNIPTAEEILLEFEKEYSHLSGTVVKIGEKGARRQLVKDTIIKFAQLHVTAALQKAAENAKARENPQDYGTGEIWVDKPSILNAYPLTNIK